MFIAIAKWEDFIIYYRKATSEKYIGDVHDALLLAKLLPNNSGEPIYFSDVVFPVINNEGKTLGVLCTHLTWQWTRDVIRSIQKDNDVDIFVIKRWINISWTG